MPWHRRTGTKVRFSSGSKKTSTNHKNCHILILPDLHPSRFHAAFLDSTLIQSGSWLFLCHPRRVVFPNLTRFQIHRILFLLHKVQCLQDVHTAMLTKWQASCWSQTNSFPRFPFIVAKEKQNALHHTANLHLLRMALPVCLEEVLLLGCMESVHACVFSFSSSFCLSGKKMIAYCASFVFNLF